MDLRDWVAYPHQIDARVAEWQARFPDFLEVHLLGCPSTLAREPILRHALLTSNLDRNPYGRARSPEPSCNGEHYTNTEYMSLVSGTDTLYWERLRRVSRGATRDQVPARLGLANEHDHVEPNRVDHGCARLNLVGQLQQRCRYESTLLTLEVQNNSPSIPYGKQLLLTDTAISRNVERLLGQRGQRRLSCLLPARFCSERAGSLREEVEQNQ